MGKISLKLVIAQLICWGAMFLFFTYDERYNTSFVIATKGSAPVFWVILLSACIAYVSLRKFLYPLGKPCVKEFLLVFFVWAGISLSVALAIVLIANPHGITMYDEPQGIAFCAFGVALFVFPSIVAILTEIISIVINKAKKH